jgi:hypothetical protein
VESARTIWRVDLLPGGRGLSLFRERGLHHGSEHILATFNCNSLDSTLRTRAHVAGEGDDAAVLVSPGLRQELAWSIQRGRYRVVRGQPPASVAEVAVNHGTPTHPTAHFAAHFAPWDTIFPTVTPSALQYHQQLTCFHAPREPALSLPKGPCVSWRLRERLREFPHDRRFRFPSGRERN